MTRRSTSKHGRASLGLPVSRALDAPRLRLAKALRRRLAERHHTDDVTVTAVALLTASADPRRADALRPSLGESAPLVERLAMWSLHRVGDEVVTEALLLLSDADLP